MDIASLDGERTANPMINRQKLIEALEEYNIVSLNRSGDGLDWEDYIKLDDVVKAIKSQPLADQWIPCSRELPPLDEEVLIHCEKDHYNVAYFDGGDFRAFDCLYDAEDVVAWKEFERYKGE